MGPPKGCKRYWYVDECGRNVIVTIRKEQEPQPHWIRGFPPRTQAVADATAQRLRQIHCGVPKSEQQKRLMSAASLGIPKSATHRASMSAAHRSRQPRIREVHSRNQHLTYHQASSLEAKLRKDPNAPSWYRELLRKS